MLSNGIDEAKGKMGFYNFSADGCSLGSMEGQSWKRVRTSQIYKEFVRNKEGKGKKVHDLAENVCTAREGF